MSKKILVAPIACALAMALSSTGCTLYFGEGGDDTWGDDCPPGTVLSYDEYGPICTGGGWACTSDADCAGGCYCAGNGTCAEAGFCSSDADCPAPLVCDEARQSCTDGVDGCTSSADCAPGEACFGGVCQPANGCTSDDQCAAGCYCDDTGVPSYCAESCYCSTDTEATGQGWGYCDETRSTCMPGIDPNAPVCGNGILETGEACDDGNAVETDGCSNLCTLTTCEAITTQAACTARADCENIYRGLNCTDPNGLACTDGAAMCTCASYVWDECQTPTP